MNKYVVAFWNDHTGELLQELVEADSEVAAAISYLDIAEEYAEDMHSMEDIHTYCVNGDSMINVFPLPGGKLSTTRGLNLAHSIV